MAGQVAQTLGIDVPPLAAERTRLPDLPLLRRKPAFRYPRPTPEHVPRLGPVGDLDQQQPHLAQGTALAEARRPLQPQSGEGRLLDGCERIQGPIHIQRVRHGQAFGDLLLGLPYLIREQRNTRGDQPMDTYSNDWALFGQDDWKVNSRLTLFLGLRYEVTGLFVDRNNIYANFVTDRRRPSRRPECATLRALLPPGAVSLDRTLTADQVGVGPALMHTDRNNFSPRLGFAYRLDQKQQDGRAWRLRDLSSHGRGARRARHHVAQSVPLHHHAQQADSGARVHDRHRQHESRASATRASI